MKHFVDISRLKTGVEVNVSNDGTFQIGDHIVIQTKIDGANSSVRWEDGKIKCFSRKQELTPTNTLRGFWNYVQKLPIEAFEIYPNYIFFGEWLCLSGDTIIRKTSAGKNENYMTLREMYKFYTSPTKDKFHYNPYSGNTSILQYLIDNPNGLSKEELYVKYCSTSNATKKEFAFNRILNMQMNHNNIVCKNNIYLITEQGKHYMDEYTIKNNWWHRYGLPSIFSLDLSQDKIISNQMMDIVYTGDKEVYRITTRKGYTIKATAEHPFLTPKGWVKLGNLQKFDCVAITDLYNHRKNRQRPRSLTNAFEEYKHKIGKCERCGATEDKTTLHLHHKDRNWRNNSISNWEVLCPNCHRDEHKNDLKFQGYEYDYEFDYIVSIEYVGVEDCYDIAMCGDENVANFVADGFIVHNCKHTIQYDENNYNQWYVYDIYDTVNERYLTQAHVKAWCEKFGMNYVETLYDGEFTGWDNVKKFLHSSKIYGDVQEGIVIKHQEKLSKDEVENGHNPSYIKIVNTEFAETKAHNHAQKVADPQKIQAQTHAMEIMATIVTENRVRKEINKMIDEGLLPSVLTERDMGIIAKNLPKRIMDDCLKEEKDIVLEAGEFAGKALNRYVMEFARKVVLG